jgi:hypothetical protein
MTLPDGTDGFDNDLYLKGNLQKLDTQAAKVAETLASASGLRMEIVEVTFNASGSSSSVMGTGTYAKPFNGTPLVLAGNATQLVSYVDTIIEPFISATANNFTCKLQVRYDGSVTNNLSAGTIKMKFLVIGS